MPTNLKYISRYITNNLLPQLKSILHLDINIHIFPLPNIPYRIWRQFKWSLFLEDGIMNNIPCKNCNTLTNHVSQMDIDNNNSWTILVSQIHICNQDVRERELIRDILVSLPFSVFAFFFMTVFAEDKVASVNVLERRPNMD